MQNQSYCNLCNVVLSSKGMGYHHHLRSEQHKMRVIEPINSRLKKISAAFTGRLLRYKYLNEWTGVKMPPEFLNEAGEAYVPHLSNVLNSYMSAKVNFELFAQYTLLKDEVEYTDIKSFQSNMTIETMCCNLQQSFKEHAETIITKIDEFQESDSGWRLNWILRLEMNFNKYMPIRGAAFIELPYKLRHKKAVINVQNKDVFCFKWTVIAALSRKRMPYRCSSYNVRIFDDFIKINDEITLNFSGLTFPLSPRDIQMFLDLNPIISITLFGYDSENENVFGPIFLYKRNKGPSHKYVVGGGREQISLYMDP
ncbi:uncharacterized protein LOC133850886 [Drosophila sulfurigaster albostrigata]|uniref:uncharacterized protein LOC133850886 n=1 Tax=Drosophila sulfurigaster albostrigata TaxID=89887 RepID=UPI002D21835F|nr:uncharacterized protein LOC133850886 [Drosophila sulfurigaster albostrigata]